LEKEKKELQDQNKSGTLAQTEIDENLRRIHDLDKKIEQEGVDQAKTKLELAKKLTEEQGNLIEAKKKLAAEEEKLANDKADRGKLTIGEIAKLQPGKSGIGENSYQPVDTFGLSAEAAEAKERAVEIQRMQAKAERLRTSGDSAGANELLGQIDTNKETLVKSGFAKSSEGDQFKAVETAIEKDTREVTKALGEIKTTLEGQHKNDK
jgi:hypothetical protein